MQIEELLKMAVEQQASDLHLKPMRPPLLRLEGKLIPMELPALKPAEIAEMLESVVTERQKSVLMQNLQVDLGYSLSGVSRFRGTIFYQRSTLAAVFRRIPFQFPSLEDWGLPDVLKEFADLPEGLVLVTGPTGSGKSSTLAALLRHIAIRKPLHIVTIEDPIEFLIRDEMAAITQREVGTDCISFAAGLKNALRQDPDVIMVGEMRDPETVATVITAAETGHLVFSTLHTNGAAQTIDRIIDAFPERQQGQVRAQVAQVLAAIVSLRLVDRADGKGRTAAVEILRSNPRVQRLIHEANAVELQQEIEQSVSYHKMQTMNQSLVSLVLTNMITKETAMANSPNPSDFDLLLRRHLGMAPARGTTEGAGFEEFAESYEGTSGDSMFPYCDYSKIVELVEVKKMQEEERERLKADLAEAQTLLTDLQEMVRRRDEKIQEIEGRLAALAEEREKWEKTANYIKQDAEAKIAKLNQRIRELTSPAPPGGANGANAVPKGGIFRK